MSGNIVIKNWEGKPMIHQGKTDCLPRDVGYDPAALERLDGHCQDLISKGLIQAACYLLARDGKIFAHRSMGKLTAAADSRDFKPDSLRPIASICSR